MPTPSPLLLLLALTSAAGFYTSSLLRPSVSQLSPAGTALRPAVAAVRLQEGIERPYHNWRQRRRGGHARRRVGAGRGRDISAIDGSE